MVKGEVSLAVVITHCIFGALYVLIYSSIHSFITCKSHVMMIIIMIGNEC